MISPSERGTDIFWMYNIHCIIYVIYIICIYVCNVYECNIYNVYPTSLISLLKISGIFGPLNIFLFEICELQSPPDAFVE